MDDNKQNSTIISPQPPPAVKSEFDFESSEVEKPAKEDPPSDKPEDNKGEGQAESNTPMGAQGEDVVTSVESTSVPCSVNNEVHVEQKEGNDKDKVESEKTEFTCNEKETNETNEQSKVGDESKQVRVEDDSGKIGLRDESEQIRARDESEQIKLSEKSEQIRVGDESEQSKVSEGSQQIRGRDESEQIRVIGVSEQTRVIGGSEQTRVTEGSEQTKMVESEQQRVMEVSEQSRPIEASEQSRVIDGIEQTKSTFVETNFQIKEALNGNIQDMQVSKSNTTSESTIEKIPPAIEHIENNTTNNESIKGQETVKEVAQNKPVVDEASQGDHHVTELIDDWCIPPSDDESELDGPTETKKRKNYEPPPDRIVELYNKINSQGFIELEWKCPGRRLPEDEEEHMEVITDLQFQNNDEEVVDESMEEDANEFDFAIDSTIDTVTPRRTPATDQRGSSKKCVARMDKVLSDIMRYQRIDEAMVKDGGTATPNPALDITPQRPLGKFHIRRDIDA